MTEEIKIIKYLLKNKHGLCNSNTLAKALHKDYKNTYTLVKQLEEKKIVLLERFGNSWRIHLKDQCHPLVYEAEYQRKEEILKNKNIKNILDYYNRNMKSNFYIMLLFGSYAKETNLKNSDIDLLFVVSDGCEEEMEKNIRRVGSLLPLKLHILVFKESDFIAMKNSRIETVGSEAIKSNVILHGIELYYWLLQ